MLDSELKSKINQLWDKFWSGGISNPLQAIEQMSYLLFMKRLEDEDIAREQNAQLSNEKYESLFKGKEGCKWSSWTNLPADKILEHVRDLSLIHISEPTRLRRISYAVFCLKKKKRAVPMPVPLTDTTSRTCSPGYNPRTA